MLPVLSLREDGRDVGVYTVLGQETGITLHSPLIGLKPTKCDRNDRETSTFSQCNVSNHSGFVITEQTPGGQLTSSVEPLFLAVFWVSPPRKPLLPLGNEACVGPSGGPPAPPWVLIYHFSQVGLLCKWAMHPPSHGAPGLAWC